MNKKVKVGGHGIPVTINDKFYLSQGGEAEIYVVNGLAYKLYHDPKHKILPAQKMLELASIGNPQVITPQDTVYDASTGDAIGYVTKFVDDVEPLLKFFNKAFKVDNHIDGSMISELVKQMQLVVQDVHAAKCLVVDLNELNILVNVDKKLIPWFIDTDSYCTPHFKATAIMDSVRDRKCSTTDKTGALHYHPTIESDWFSWAILTFWAYSNIHPYRGGHKDYKPSDKRKQMDDGISVFHPGVRVPPTVNNFNVIPPRHLDYYKQVFLKGDRGVPPLPDGTVPILVPTSFVTVKSTDKISVDQVGAFPEAVLQVIDIMGVKYTLTTTRVFMGTRDVNTYGKCKKAALCSTPDGVPILAVLDDGKVTFTNAIEATVYGTISSTDMFVRNKSIYTMAKGRMVENTFKTMGSKVFHTCSGIENISMLSAKMFDGCIVQDLLGKKYLTLPYDIGRAWSKYMPFLDGYRVVDAKADMNVVVFVAEKKGKYDRFVVVFTKAYTQMDVKKDEDVAYNGINFATMPNGLSILMTSDDEIRLFRDTNGCESLIDPPFDSAMKLFTTSDGFHFINGTSIHHIKRK